MGDPNFVKDKDSFVRLWAHECLRVFHDRLVDDSDRVWFKTAVSTTVKEFFNADYVKLCGENPNTLYCNFSDPKSLQKPYVELIDRSNLPKVMNDYLEDYNQMTTKPMNLVLFQSAIEHLSLIHI